MERTRLREIKKLEELKESERKSILTYLINIGQKIDGYVEDEDED